MHNNYPAHPQNSEKWSSSNEYFEILTRSAEEKIGILFSRFALKVIVASTAVYYTKQLEIWEPLSHEERAYDRAIAEVAKLINENKPEALKLQVNCK